MPALAVAERVTSRGQAVRLEGGLFGPDFLALLKSGELPGQKAADFGIADRPLIEEIAAAYRDAKRYWEAFRSGLERLPPDDPGTSLTRERWMIPFLSLLGYEPRYNRRAYEVDGQTFAISHRAGENEDAPPVHIVGAQQKLGERPPSGRPRLSPHALVQEYLNRTEHTWGLVTNGKTLRLLRKTPMVRHQAYVEFDLEAIFEEERFRDFEVLYRLLHRTRLPRGLDDAHECWLERYYLEAIEQGTRARDRLRDSVVEALRILGNGFLKHPKNADLRKRALQEKDSYARKFYQELLRLVYRFLFLLVAEERELLGGSDLYREHYSVSRLRRLADHRRAYTDHEDFWHSLRALWHLLRDSSPKVGGKPLASLLDLPVLDGELFQGLELENWHLANSDLLEAFWYLSYYRAERGILRRVNYAYLDVEELGSVYESLLDYQPIIVEENGFPTFKFAEGTERKSTGSYYTPRELVAELVKSALEPVLEERLAEAKRLASSEWRIVTAEAQRDPRRKEYVRRIISRLGRLAAGHGASRTSLRADQGVPEGRAVRDGLPNPPGSQFNSSQHSGGMGQGADDGVPPVPPGGHGELEGVGDPSAPEPARRLGIGGGNPSTSRFGRNPEPPTPCPPAQPSEEEIAALWDSLPLATRYSLLAEEAILSLKVCDPATGSGHFLLAAARRLGKELARVRTGEEEPSPEAQREAIRDLITHCIYGVDVNPLAVELCKVALWIEGHTPGKPLTFLDHRIKCGNSLIGVFDLSVLEEGIPDDAYKPVTGDDKEVAKTLRKQNKNERKAWKAGQYRLFEEDLRELAAKFTSLGELSDATPEEIKRKKKLYLELMRDPRFQRDRTACNLWTAAFFSELTPKNAGKVPTSEVLRRYLEGKPIDPRILAYAEALAEQYKFFHWPLEFPEVFAANSEQRVANGESRVVKNHSPVPTRYSPGFDVVLSNPPWERIKLEEKQFFETRAPEIARAPNKAARKELIDLLLWTNPDLWREYQEAKHFADALGKFLRVSGRFPLTARGDINTYSVFAELGRSLINERGRTGMVLPTGIATDDTNKHFFADLVESGQLGSLFDFENREKLFPAVDSRQKFSLVTLRGREANGDRGRVASGERRVAKDHSLLPTGHSQFAFFCTRTEHLRDPRRVFTLSPEDIARINPNTRTCPIFRTRQDAELTKAIYRRVPVLVNEATGENPWGISFLRMFDMANDSHLFRTREELEEAGYELVGNRFVKRASGGRRVASSSKPLTTRHSPLAEVWLPLYEAKMIWHYDHRFGTYEGVTSRSSTHLPTPDIAKHADPGFLTQPWYWVPAEEVDARLGEWRRGWLLGFRNVARSTDERTAIFSLLPRAGVGNSLPIMLLGLQAGALYAALYANFVSFVFDWVVRQKLAGVNMNFFYVQQFPVLPPDAYTPEDLHFIVPRVLELVYTAWDIKPFADDVWREAADTLREAIRRQWEENRAATGGNSFELPDWAEAYPEVTPADPSILESSGSERVASSGEPLVTRYSPLAVRHSPHCPLPPFKWDESRRARIRAELDAYYARLYGLTRKQLRYILDPADLTERELEDILDPWEEVRDPLDPEAYAERVRKSTFPGETFRVLKEKEIRQFGEYRTRRLVLEAWKYFWVHNA